MRAAPVQDVGSRNWQPQKARSSLARAGYFVTLRLAVLRMPRVRHQTRPERERTSLINYGNLRLSDAA
jgi:hypothetical protein